MEIRYTGQEYYDIDLAGRTERLPITPVTPTLHIAGFVLLGNTNLTNYCAKVLGDKIRMWILTTLFVLRQKHCHWHKAFAHILAKKNLLFSAREQKLIW